MHCIEPLKVSIITVCLNAETTIERSIISVISQTYPFIEYIIIDGKSTDNTIKIINKYQDKISVFISEKDSGIYNAMNKGIARATGDFIYFLGADDILNDDIIKEVIPYLNSNINCVHYGQVVLVPSYKLFGGKFSKWRLIHKNIAHQSIFYPNDVFIKKIYNEKYKIVADWDLNLYLMSKKIKFKYNGLIIASFNTLGISKNGEYTFQKDQRKMVKEYFGIIEWTFLIIGIQIPILILNFIITKYYKMKKFFFNI